GVRGVSPGKHYGPGVRLLSPADVRSLLAAHDVRPSRALGQNFLADPNTARRIVRLAGVGPGQRILEIGPGVGSLTVALAEAVSPGGEVLALELDRHLLPVLGEVVGGLPEVRVVHGDALSADYDALLDGAGPWCRTCPTTWPRRSWPGCSTRCPGWRCCRSWSRRRSPSGWRRRRARGRRGRSR